MTIVVTGAAGFIGSNLIHALNRCGHNNIIAVDDCKDADQFRNLNRCRFTDLIESREFINRLSQLPHISAILHQGAISATTERDGRALLSANIDYSKRLLAWCQQQDASLIYASSASVYGNGDKGFSDIDLGCEYPLNGYAFSKWLFDRHVRTLTSDGCQGAQIVGLRYFNVYGPQEWHKGGMCSPVLHFHRQMQNDGVLKLFTGSDRFRRDFITVQDCCSVILFFLERPHLSGIFNCGTGIDRSFAEVAQLMAPRYPNAVLTDVPFPEHLKGKYQAFTRADLRHLRAVGYEQPFTSLENGISAYVDLLQSSNNGYLPE